MSELYGSSSGGETHEPASETKPATPTDQEHARDTAARQHQDNAAIEARLDEAGLPTRAESRAAARRFDAADVDDGGGFSHESNAAIEARLDEAGLPTRAESRAAVLRPAVTDDYNEDSLTNVVVHDQHGHDWPLTVVHLDPEDRTVGDDTLTGIGLKPTGDQLRNIESDKLSRGDRLRRNVYERMDDFRDASEKNAGALEGFLGSHRPTGHDVVHATQPAIEAPQSPPADVGSIATAGLVLGLLADRAIHQAREWLRRSKG
jgi:hypothetical protein